MHGKAMQRDKPEVNGCRWIQQTRSDLGVSRYGEPEVDLGHFPSNQTFQTLSIQGNEKRVTRD